MAVNYYPPCPQLDIAFGLPPHSDYSCWTIVLQSSEGLEFLGKEDESWRKVPNVHVGDHLEVLSNGIYKSVVHRATLNRERTRISITSLHSLGGMWKWRPRKSLWMSNIPRDTKKVASWIFWIFYPRVILLKEKTSWIRSRLRNSACLFWLCYFFSVSPQKSSAKYVSFSCKTRLMGK